LKNRPFFLPDFSQDVQYELETSLTRKYIKYAFSVDKLIAYISQFITLKIGDLLFIAISSGVGKLAINDHLQGYLKKKLLDFYVK
jgi:2-keto-4-pentenoate hydratase/2-oxohepta-3-ene-1,7-dioic acid hydratase in catechol pathway